MSPKRSSGGQAAGKRGAPTRPTDPFDLVIIGLDTDDGPDHRAVLRPSKEASQ